MYRSYGIALTVFTKGDKMTSMYNPFDSIVSLEDLTVNLPEDEYARRVDEDTAQIVNITNRIEREEYVRDDNHEALEYVLEICSEASRVARAMQASEYPGNEGLMSMARNAVFGLANSVIMIGNLLATGLFSGWREFKRLELTEYIDSNRVTIPRLYKLNLASIKDVKVPIPQGMQTNYVIASNYLVSYLNEADMPHLIEAMNEIATAIAREAKKTSNLDMSTYRESLESLGIVKLQGQFEQSWKVFAPNVKTFDEIPFEDAFGTTEGLKRSVETTLKAESHFRQVGKAHKNTERLEETFKRLVNMKESIDGKQLEILSEVTRSFAVCISNYATILNDVNRVQHNLKECLRYVRKAAGY